MPNTWVSNENQRHEPTTFTLVLHAYQVQETEQTGQPDEPAKTAQLPTQTKEQQERHQPDEIPQRSKRHIIASFL